MEWMVKRLHTIREVICCVKWYLCTCLPASILQLVCRHCAIPVITTICWCELLKCKWKYVFLRFVYEAVKSCWVFNELQYSENLILVLRAYTMQRKSSWCFCLDWNIFYFDLELTCCLPLFNKERKCFHGTKILWNYILWFLRLLK